MQKGQKSDAAALEKCLNYILEQKTEIKVLFSEHAEHYLAAVCMEIIDELAVREASVRGTPDRQDEYLLGAAASASAFYGFIQIWLTKDISRPPKELVEILKRVMNGNLFM